MTYDDLVRLYCERSLALQSLWVMHVAVIGGLLLLASLGKVRGFLATVLLTLLFGLLAFYNLEAIRDVTVQRFAVLDGLRQSIPVGDCLAPALVPPAYARVRGLHLASDLLAVVLFWAMERRRKPSV